MVILLGRLAIVFSIPLLIPLTALADVTIHVGPAAVGGGGPNPMSIPPINPLDYEFVWVTESRSEWSLSLVPGAFYGRRSAFTDGSYVSVGAGFVQNVYGIGPGFYSAFGWDRCGWFCFNIEYKQAIGYVPTRVISPYALRMGATFSFD